MRDLQTEFFWCPYCGERIELVLDCSADSQEYIEDCSVCCRPIIISLNASEGELVDLTGRTEDD